MNVEAWQSAILAIIISIRLCRAQLPCFHYRQSISVGVDISGHSQRCKQRAFEYLYVGCDSEDVKNNYIIIDPNYGPEVTRS